MMGWMGWVCCGQGSTRFSKDDEFILIIAIIILHLDYTSNFKPPIINFSLSSMSALFNFQSFLTMIVLFICTCAYIRHMFPYYINNNYREGFKGVVRRSAVIGDRLSPYVSGACVFFAVANIFYR